MFPLLPSIGEDFLEARIATERIEIGAGSCG
jgi:hypothetical protein